MIRMQMVNHKYRSRIARSDTSVIVSGTRE